MSRASFDKNDEQQTKCNKHVFAAINAHAQENSIPPVFPLFMILSEVENSAAKYKIDKVLIIFHLLHLHWEEQHGNARELD